AADQVGQAFFDGGQVGHGLCLARRRRAGEGAPVCHAAAFPCRRNGLSLQVMTWTIPNILTTLRLLAAPGVAVMFLYFNRPWADWAALTLFVGAAITDWFDGY